MSAYRWLGAAWFPLQGHLVDLLLCVVLVQRYLESTQTTWLSLTAYIRLAAEAFSRSSHPLANKLVVLVGHKTAFCVVNVNSQQMGKETQTNVPQAKITYVQNYIHFGKRTIIQKGCQDCCYLQNSHRDVTVETRVERQFHHFKCIHHLMSFSHVGESEWRAIMIAVTAHCVLFVLSRRRQVGSANYIAAKKTTTRVRPLCRK